MDTNTLNLDTDSDPRFWPNLDPDPVPGPDPGLYNNFERKNSK